MTELFERISRLSPQRLALLVMDLQSKLDAVQRARQEPIAIVPIPTIAIGSGRATGCIDSSSGHANCWLGRSVRSVGWAVMDSTFGG